MKRTPLITSHHGIGTGTGTNLTDNARGLPLAHSALSFSFQTRSGEVVRPIKMKLICTVQAAILVSPLTTPLCSSNTQFFLVLLDSVECTGKIIIIKQTHLQICSKNEKKKHSILLNLYSSLLRAIVEFVIAMSGF